MANVLKENNSKHCEKLCRRIENNMFNLLIDLDDQTNQGYPNPPLNIMLKYHLINKILYDHRINMQMSNDNLLSSYITFGKHKDNSIKIIEILNTDKYNKITSKKDIIIANNDYECKDIVKMYKCNFVPLIKYVHNVYNNYTCKYNSFNELRNCKNINISIINKIKIKTDIIINDNKIQDEGDKMLLNKEFEEIGNKYNFNFNKYENLIGYSNVTHKDKDRRKHILKESNYFDIPDIKIEDL